MNIKKELFIWSNVFKEWKRPDGWAETLYSELFSDTGTGFSDGIYQTLRLKYRQKKEEYEKTIL